MIEGLKGLETAQEKVARMLSATGVSVTFDPRVKIPMVDVEHCRIMLPPLPDDMNATELDRLRGYLDHEISHILFSRDKSGKPQQNTANRPDAMTVDGLIANALEDGRVNRAMGRRYIGSAHNIHRLTKLTFEESARAGMLSGEMTPAKEKFIALSRASLAYVERDATLAEMLPDTIPCPDNVRQTLEKIETLEDVFAAIPVVKEWLFAEPEPEPEPQPNEDGEEGEDGESKGKSGKGKGKSKGKAKSKPESGDEPSDPESGEEDGGKAEGQDADEKPSKGKRGGKNKPSKAEAEDDVPEEGDAEEGEDEKDAEDGESKDGKNEADGPESDEKDGGQGDTPTSGQKGQGGATEGQGDDSEGDPEDAEPQTGSGTPQGFGAGASEEASERRELAESELADFLARWDEERGEAITELVRPEASSSVIPYLVDTSADEEIHIRDLSKRYSAYTSARHKERGQKLFASLGDKVGALRGRLILDLQTVGRAWAKDLERGRSIQTTALHRPAVGDARIFKSKLKRETVDTAVCILVDNSGSMGSGGKFETALQLAAITCDALEMANVPVEVLGFTTSEHKQPKYGIRHEALLNIVYKAYHERAGAYRALWYDAEHAQADNVDGESVLWAARRLAARPEKRKILLVLSDGMPAAHVDSGRSKYQPGWRTLDDHLSDAVKAVERTGIEVVGIGIMADAPKNYYKRYVKYNSLGDLMQGFYKGISDLLRTGKLTLGKTG